MLRSLLMIASFALVGCAEAPKGHETSTPASTPPPPDAGRQATKIPMH